MSDGPAADRLTNPGPSSPAANLAELGLGRLQGDSIFQALPVVVSLTLVSR